MTIVKILYSFIKIMNLKNFKRLYNDDQGNLNGRANFKQWKGSQEIEKTFKKSVISHFGGRYGYGTDGMRRLFTIKSCCSIFRRSSSEILTGWINCLLFQSVPCSSRRLPEYAG